MWDWSVLNEFLPPDICRKIAGLKPPSSIQDDFPIWNHSCDGFFTIKSAYDTLYQELETDPPNFPFHFIWKLPLPPRVKTFIWRVTHSRLMTNATRKERGISNLDTCPRCLQHLETIMHVLRDCEVSLEI